MRVLSGIQSSGTLHLGNYFGMMKRMIKYQNENDLFCFIANYHALTTLPDARNITPINARTRANHRILLLGVFLFGAISVSVNILVTMICPLFF